MAQTLALIGALVLVLLLNAAMVLYFARSDHAADPAELGGGSVDPAESDDRPGASPAADGWTGNRIPESPAPPLETDGPTVDCRHCGTANQANYQYCRWCISPLGGDGSNARAGAAASGRAF